VTPDELADYIRERLEDRVTAAQVAYGQLTLTVVPEALPVAARLCKEDPALDFAFFDFMAGVDLAEEGFAVVTHLYSLRHRHHISLRAVAPGGREAPKLPTITDVYRGADWHEREAYDMFGVEFEGHPGLLPRILTVENFEGFPLRKEFLLTTREAKPWPGLKEPKEEGDDEPGDSAAEATADAALAADDKAKAAKERAERAKKKAAEMRAKKARERAAAEQPPGGGDQSERAAAEQPPAGGGQSERAAAEQPAAGDAAGGGEASGGATGEAPQADLDAPQEPMAAAEQAGTDIAQDAAAGAVGGDTAAGATQDEPGVEEPVENRPAEELTAEGAKPQPGASPGMTRAGRTDSAEPAPPSGDAQSRGGSPRHDEPQGTDAPTEPAHSPAAEVAPEATEDFEVEDAGEAPPARGTDARERSADDADDERREGEGT
jgi:NADH:ubiquinone oxidoreductase subunit C